MSLFEPISQAIGEASAYLIGRLVGQTFDLEEGKAQRIGETVVVSVILGAAVVVTLLFS